MLAEFRRHWETMTATHHLGEAIDWLPGLVWELDFRDLREARVTTPTAANPTAHFDRGMEHLRSAESYRGLTQNSPPEYMSVLHDRIVAGDLEFEGVLEAGFVDALRADPDRASLWRDLADRTWLYDGHVPLNMHLVDGTVLVWLCGEDDAGDDVLPKGLLESANPAVRSWAEALYAEYWGEAEPLDPRVLPTD